MKPYKVFIVDDDLPILQSLRNFPWQQCGCSLAGEAQNGEDALRMCMDINAQIIITDIVMPLMDGIALIRRLKDWNPHIQFIIITSYRDFEYAKDAIHLGVKEYLIKGVYTDEELLLALNRAKDEYDKEAFSIQYKNEADSILKNETLVNMLYQEDGVNNAGSLSLKFPFRLIIIQPAWSTPPGLLSVKKLNQLLFAYKAEHLYIDEIIIHSSREIHLLYKDKDLNLIVKDISNLIKEIETSISSCSKCFAAIGNIVNSLGWYKTVAEENCRALQKKFYYTLSSIFISEQINLRLLSNEEKHNLALTIRAFTSAEELERYLKNEFTCYMIDNNIDPDEVKQLFLVLLSDMLKECSVEKSLHFTIGDMPDECLDGMIEKYIYMYKDIHSSAFQKGRYEISKALQIINQKLNSNLTADKIADEISLSPNYFGYIFKKYVGQNFKEYLTKVRMEKALFLIRNTDLKVYEIGEKVGIQNYRYFISVFEKYYGKSPSDAKKGD